MTTPNTDARGFTQWDLFAGILPAVACTPLLIQQVAVLGTKPHMSFYPITAVAFVILLILGARTKSNSGSDRNLLVAVSLLALGTAALAAAALRDSATLGQVAFVLFIGGWATGRYRSLHWGTTVGWMIFLASTIPLPRAMDRTILDSLYASSMSGTSAILDALEITHVQHGSSVEVEKAVLVGSDVAATWGSIFGLASFALGLAAFRHYGLVVATLTLALVPLWAWIGNILRSTAIAVAIQWYGRDLSNGKDYLLLHVATFLLSAALVWLSSRFLRNVFTPIGLADSKFGGFFTSLNQFFAWPGSIEESAAVAEDGSPATSGGENPASGTITPGTDNALLGSLLPKILGVAAVLLMILPASRLLGGGLADLRFRLPAYTKQDALQTATGIAMPQQTTSGWTLIQEDLEAQTISSRGQYSIYWRYGNREKQFATVLSLPFLGWNDPTERWTQRGWELQKEKAYETDGWLLVECELANELGDWRYIIYSLATESGEPFNAAPERIEADPAKLAGNKNRTAVTRCLQLVAEPAAKLTSSDIAEYRGQFVELRNGLLSTQ